MARIKKPSPPEHIVLVDTNILWHEDKGFIVNPDFDEFWNSNATSFPMKLIIPEVVRGELLYQQTTSAMKHLDKANQEFDSISRITGKSYSHRVKEERIKIEIEKKFDAWVQSKQAEVKSVQTTEINWHQVIYDSVWRKLPFTPDPKNPKNEKGFRDYMILETVCAVCKFYSEDVNIAFLCDDFALREAAEHRLGSIEGFSVYESIPGFISFIDLTKKNLTERFVKNILSKAALKFHNDEDRESLIYKNGFIKRLRKEFKGDIENPSSKDPFSFFDLDKLTWKLIGKEQVWVTRPHYKSLEGDNIYHWTSKLTFVRLFEREKTGLSSFAKIGEKRLMILKVNVHWKSTVRSDGRFLNCQIVDSEKSDYQFEPPTEEQLDRYGIQKKIEQGATANQTQPTAPSNGRT